MLLTVHAVQAGGPLSLSPLDPSFLQCCMPCGLLGLFGTCRQMHGDGQVATRVKL